MRKVGRRAPAAAALTAVLALALSACGAGRTDDATSSASGSASSAGGGNTGAAIVVGTTDKLTTLDPAGSYDNGSFNVQYQVFRFVLGFAPGNPTPQPDLAESCSFTEPTVYECKLKSGQTFANGNPLDANAVKFSFDRQVAIADPNGPSSLLANLDSVSVKDDLTVDFTLKSPNDVTFEQVLASPVGPLVDPKTFPADAVMPDADIVAAKAFAGPYTIATFQLNQLVEFQANADYAGVQGKAANTAVTLKYYTDANNMRLDIAKGDIDVATRSLTPTDIDTLKTTQGVTVYTGPGGEQRFITFNLDTMPGETAEQKFAVRQAVASLVDRQKLSDQIYKGTYTPLYSYIPEGLPGSNEVLKDTYGAAPDADKAAAYLSDAGVTTPVDLKLQYNPDHYGSSSADEYGEIKKQLEASGLFKVDLQATEWVTYNKERVADAYPVYQLGWFPDFPDADNYLTPFFDQDNFINNHFSDPGISDLLDQERTTTDAAAREKLLVQIQSDLATKFLPTLPLLQGAQVAVGRDGITGIDKTLDASFQFRFATLSKS